MCYTVEYLETRSAKYAERYGHVLSPEAELPRQLPLFYLVSGFEHPELPVVHSEGVFLYRWGLIPPWVRSHDEAMEISNRTLNAMGETVFEKPAFRQSIRSHRCLLGINGFYEWRTMGKKKYPYLIQPESGGLLSLGCIYNAWTDRSTGELLHTFSILTTESNALLSKIHNLKKRMPLIIPKENEQNWIDPELTETEIKNLIRPFPDEGLTAYTISMEANQVRNQRNKPEITEEVIYPELAESA